ncbi:hypothetical protein VNO80_26730 [Phaseolus coccineus]|uniref:Uncharacterized protein n=1 Tax=Phaseolus coccineus TaxID=3886 RepID=A0AAN9LG51_PHACN
MLANHKQASNTRFGAFGPKESWFKQVSVILLFVDGNLSCHFACNPHQNERKNIEQKPKTTRLKHVAWVVAVPCVTKPPTIGKGTKGIDVADLHEQHTRTILTGFAAVDKELTRQLLDRMGELELYRDEIVRLYSITG